MQEQLKPQESIIYGSQPAPEQLVSSVSGMPEYGLFDGIVESLSQELYDYRTPMDKPASKFAKHFDFKQFQFVVIHTPRYVIALALADIRYVGSAFCYLYDIRRDEMTQSTWMRPLSKGLKMTSSPMQGVSFVGNRGEFLKIEIIDGLWHVNLETMQVKADVKLVPAALSLPIAVCTPCGYSGWSYTQKHNGLKVVGQLDVQFEPQPLNQALAAYDFTAGYLRRETSWRWASISAHIDEGIMGLNLAAGVNETGATENVFWINGERHLLGPVQFDFSRYGNCGGMRQIERPWHLHSADGKIDLHFRPVNRRCDKLNLWFLQNNFRQYLGHFSGHIIDNQNRHYSLSQVLGLTEDHYSRW